MTGIAPGQITIATSFADDLGDVELDILAMLMDFEEDFEINIPEGEEVTLITVADAIRFFGSSRIRVGNFSSLTA